MAHYVDCSLSEEVEFLVGKGLGRGDHNALPGMDAERVEILHIADRDAVVVAVAHHFIFDFFPAAQGFLHEHLRREGKGLGGYGAQLFLVLAEA